MPFWCFSAHGQTLQHPHMARPWGASWCNTKAVSQGTSNGLLTARQSVCIFVLSRPCRTWDGRWRCEQVGPLLADGMSACLDLCFDRGWCKGPQKQEHEASHLCIVVACRVSSGRAICLFSDMFQLRIYCVPSNSLPALALQHGSLLEASRRSLAHKDGGTEDTCDKCNWR